MKESLTGGLENQETQGRKARNGVGIGVKRDKVQKAGLKRSERPYDPRIKTGNRIEYHHQGVIGQGLETERTSGNMMHQ